MKRVTVVVYLLTAALYAQSTQNNLQMTNGRLNGRLWQGLSDFEKSLYIQSMVEGVALSRDFVKSVNSKSKSALVHDYSIHVQSDKACVAVNQLILTKVSTYLPNLEVTRRMDKFYQAKGNLSIPIVEAVIVVTAEIQGASEKDIRAYTIAFRREATREGENTVMGDPP